QKTKWSSLGLVLKWVHPFGKRSLWLTLAVVVFGQPLEDVALVHAALQHLLGARPRAHERHLHLQVRGAASACAHAGVRHVGTRPRRGTTRQHALTQGYDTSATWVLPELQLCVTFSQ
ncbi:jg6135, partial [Pararge aegeria aegeria]